MGDKTKHGQLNTLGESWRWGLSLEQLAWDSLKVGENQMMENLLKRNQV